MGVSSCLCLRNPRSRRRVRQLNKAILWQPPIAESCQAQRSHDTVGYDFTDELHATFCFSSALFFFCRMDVTKWQSQSHDSMDSTSLDATSHKSHLEEVLNRLWYITKYPSGHPRVQYRQIFAHLIRPPRPQTSIRIRIISNADCKRRSC